MPVGKLSNELGGQIHRCRMRRLSSNDGVACVIRLRGNTTLLFLTVVVFACVATITSCSSKSISPDAVASVQGDFNLSGTWEWRYRDDRLSGCLVLFWWENEMWNGLFRQDPNVSEPCDYLEETLERALISGGRITLWFRSPERRWAAQRRLEVVSPTLMRERTSGWFYLQKRETD